MPDQVLEALLEAMHLKPLTDLIALTHGVRVLKFIKPSQQLEKHVGFDQGWVKTADMDDFLAELRAHTSAGGPAPRDFFGFFLQYKAPRRMLRASRNMPPAMRTPYHRGLLSTKSDPGLPPSLSQHQVLRKLSALDDACTHYCLPEIFDADDVYEEPDLTKLRFFDLKTAPDYLDDATHYVCFEPGSSHPIWMSEPTAGQGRGAREFAGGLRLMSAAELGDWLERVDDTLRWLNQPSMPASLCLIAVEPRPN